MRRDKHAVMEREWFEWEEYDIHWSVLTFIGCVLKQQLGRYPVGTGVRRIDIDLVNGEMLMWVHDSREPPDLTLDIGYKLITEVN